MEIRQHRGQQYKYGGRICGFLCNTGRIYDELPLLPKELNVLVPCEITIQAIEISASEMKLWRGYQMACIVDDLITMDYEEDDIRF